MEIHITLEGRRDLTGQIYRQLRSGIVEGRLAANARLPSTRDLAAQLNVSRKTTLDVFERLIAEGFLRTRAGDGTFVAEGLARLPAAPRAPSPASARAAGIWGAMPAGMAPQMPAARALAGDGARGAAGSRASPSATKVPSPARVRKKPSAIRRSKTSSVVFLDTLSCAARSRVDGRRAFAASRPSTMPERNWR
ncbi:transcriptional regulator [Caballeronia telluris]|uniref:Transcriptional regulator n=1 Tax=Caballeronia telluris TaxID=326475 RepID=A0A158IQ95_9BURK|nr:transcriptional regulator [Caballeronia telluris]